MNKPCCTLFCATLLATIATGAFAADVTVDSSTLLGISKKELSRFATETSLDSTQFLGLTADKLGDGNLSLNAYGWGRASLADRAEDNNKTNGDLTYGYLQYRVKPANTTIRAGRLFVHEGIANEHISGASVRTDLPMGFGVSVFGGATVHGANIYGESTDGKGNMLFGGRANYRYAGLLEIGLSGVYESDAPVLFAHTTKNYRRIGGDLWLTPVNSIDIIGHSSYNPETQEIAEHSYLLNYKLGQHVVLTGEYNQQRVQSYMYTWSPLTSYFNPAEKSSTYGLRAYYQVNSNLEVSVDTKHYVREFGSADRYGGDVRANFQNNTIRGGLSYHYLHAGEGFAIGNNPSASYQEIRCYIMRDSKSYFGALDMLSSLFRENVYGIDGVYDLTGSIGYHFSPALALSGDLTYGRNPDFTREVKGLLRLTYNMTYAGIGGKNAK